MFHQLILDCYKKAREESGFERTTQLSKHLSDQIDQVSKLSVNERTLRNYYNSAMKVEQLSIKHDVANALAVYLGYANYIDYRQFLIESAQGGNKDSTKKILIGVFIAIGLVIFSIIGVKMTSKDCMIWSESGYYERSNCDLTVQKNAIPFDENVFNRMKRLEATCQHEFFDKQGEPKVWYAKKGKDEIELFSHYGLHPVTKKTLKPITPYIVDKYLCNSHQGS